MKKMKKYMLILSHSGATEVWEYIDDVEEARKYWYVDQAIDKYGVESMMPIVMNKLGGYHTHKPDASDVIGIIESENWPDLELYELYPRNASDFKTGWIAPHGDTYKCDYADHLSCASKIVKCLYKDYSCKKTLSDEFLLSLGWFKCTNRKYTGYGYKMSDSQAKFFYDNCFTCDLDCEDI